MITASVPTAVAAFVIGYVVGSIPWAYIIVRFVAHEDVTQHGTGNVGAMNVRRSTGSWGWFAVAMCADGFKGIIPVAIAKGAVGTFTLMWLMTPASTGAGDSFLMLLVIQAMLAGAVLGHNYSLWMALLKKKFARTGKGLATGGGALLAYDWRYFVAVVVVGLAVIAITRYMMAGQVAASFALPATAIVLRSPDWPFALAMGVLVYAAHHKRFVGLLKGREPKLYVNDGSGPRG